MVVCHCCQFELVKTRTILSRALDIGDRFYWESMESAGECNIRQARREIHLAPVKALLSTAVSRHGCAGAQQGAHRSSTVLLSIKLVKVTL